MDLSRQEREPTAREWYERGRAKLKEGDAAAAIDPLTEAIAQDPDHHGARLTLGIAYGQLGDYELAEAAFESVIAAAPLSPQARYYLGVTRREAGDTEGAKRALLEALQLDPAHAPSRKALAALAPESLPEPPPAEPEKTLCLCPECQAPVPRRSSTTACAVCGTDLTAVYRGWVVPSRDLAGRQELVCRGCRKPVLDLRGRCDTCGISYLTGERRLTDEAASAEQNQLGFSGVPGGATLDWPPEALAPPWHRAGAYLVDITGVSIFGSLVASVTGVVPWPLSWILYEGVCVGWRGQTLGKWFVGASVEGVDGSDVPYGQAFLRAAAKWLPAIPQAFLLYEVLHPPTLDFVMLIPPLGGLLALFTRHKQSLHDLVARTVVSV